MVRILLNSSVLVSVLVYLLWNKLGLDQIQRDCLFFIGNSLFIFMLCLIIWISLRKYLASFVLLCLSFNNLLDELFFDNTKIGLNEYIFAIILIIITYIRYRYARKTNTHN